MIYSTFFQNQIGKVRIFSKTQTNVNEKAKLLTNPGVEKVVIIVMCHVSSSNRLLVSFPFFHIFLWWLWLHCMPHNQVCNIAGFLSRRSHLLTHEYHLWWKSKRCFFKLTMSSRLMKCSTLGSEAPVLIISLNGAHVPGLVTESAILCLDLIVPKFDIYPIINALCVTLTTIINLCLIVVVILKMILSKLSVLRNTVMYIMKDTKYIILCWYKYEMSRKYTIA